MESQKITVLVCRKGELQFAKTVSIRRLPNGYAGVFDNGRIYPIQSDRTIEIDGISFAPDECSGPILKSSERPPIEREEKDIKWFYEVTISGYYLAFDGNSAIKDSLSLVLERRGIPIWKVGPSFRRAGDGHQYDWYIKLQQNLSRAAIEEIISSVAQKESIKRISQTKTAKGMPSAAADLAGINSQTAAWRNEAAILRQQLRGAEDEKVLSKGQLASLTREVDVLKNRLENMQGENSLLKSQIEFLEKAKASRAIPQDRIVYNRMLEEIKLLKGKLLKCQDDNELLNKLAEDEKEHAERNKLLEEEIERLSSEIIILKEKALESELVTGTIVKPSLAGKNRSIEIIQRAFETYLPRFVFHDKTYATICGDFSEVSKLFSQLYAFHEKKKIERKPIKNTEGWFEMKDHISTGRDDRGRIYFRRRGSKDSFDIYIHHKKDDAEQAKLFEKLGDMAPFTKD